MEGLLMRLMLICHEQAKTPQEKAELTKNYEKAKHHEVLYTLQG
jgi:hypothetical protein